MKKTLLATVILLAITSVAQATEPVTASQLHVSGAVGNSVSAIATVNNAVGTSQSYAASTGLAKADAYSTTAGSTYVPGSFTSATSTIGCSTETSNTGVVYNISTGGGTGSATSQGFADAGSQAASQSKINGTTATLNLTGFSDSGHPTNVGFGTDIALSAGRNQGVNASADAGSDYKATGTLQYSYGTPGAVSGSVSDSKTASAFGTTGYGPVLVNSSALDLTNTVQLLNASSKSGATAAGQFNFSK